VVNVTKFDAVTPKTGETLAMPALRGNAL